MGRMQVLILGLRLMLTWAGGASSTMVDLSKTLGLWYHIFTASNQLEELRDENYLRIYTPRINSLGQHVARIWLSFDYSYRGYCGFVTYSIKRQLNRSDLTWEPTESIWISLNSKDEGNVPPPNLLDLVQVSDTLLLLRFVNQGLGSPSGDTYTIVALGRKYTLSEVDMAEFQKVLGDNEIVTEPVNFISLDVCINVYLSKK